MGVVTETDHMAWKTENIYYLVFTEKVCRPLLYNLYFLSLSHQEYPFIISSDLPHPSKKYILQKILQNFYKSTKTLLMGILNYFIG